MWVLYVTSSCHRSGSYNLKVASVYLGNLWTLVMYALAVSDTTNRKGTDAPVLLRRTFP
jgi:hypothetical protein